jgi:hypothetical protein
MTTNGQRRKIHYLASPHRKQKLPKKNGNYTTGGNMFVHNVLMPMITVVGQSTAKILESKMVMSGSLVTTARKIKSVVKLS